MTDQEINEAIAEACGWNPSEGDLAAVIAWKDLTGEPAPTRPPSYTSDLNAMHEAEKTLTYKQQHQYVDIITRANYETDNTITHSHAWDAINATAHERAEIFVHVIGKWREK